MTSIALHSSLAKRAQMLVMVFHAIAIPLCVSAFFFCCAIPLLWPLLLGYIIFMLVDPRPGQGFPLTPLQRMVRNSTWWKLFAAYFPITLHKTVDLAPCFEVGRVTPARVSLKSLVSLWTSIIFWWFPPFTWQKPESPRPTGRRYIFGCHPHGIVGMGALGGIATDGAHWSKLFPGIPTRLLTLTNNFYIPFYREYLLSMGIAMVSKSSCLKLLKSGNPIAIVLGGARESLLAEPGKMDLVLAKRFGFVKIALETGASLVPIICFGENELFRQARSEGTVARIHEFMTRNLGFTVPLFHARGIFNYDVGILPYREPVNVVVGAPIDVPHVPTPSQAEIDKYHALYLKALKDLFDENKAKYAPHLANTQLNYVP